MKRSFATTCHVFYTQVKQQVNAVRTAMTARTANSGNLSCESYNDQDSKASMYQESIDYEDKKDKGTSRASDG